MIETNGRVARPDHEKGDVRREVEKYRGFHDESSKGTVEARSEHYDEMVKSYYDLVTDFFEYGWGESFHFAPRFKGESFLASIARHQHYLASRLRLSPGMKVLDVGCGIGGPMRSIARFSGASVEGININTYQLERARKLCEEAGLSNVCSFIEHDFMKMPVKDGTYDAAYGFEATCHAPDKTALFREIHRVLKPGAEFAAYEWCLTDRFDPNRPAHLKIKKDIEEGDGLPDIWTIPATKKALLDAGFEILESEDRAPSADPQTPWYLPISGRELTWTGVRRSRVGQRLTWGALTIAERFGLVPKGTMNVSQFLHIGADALVAGGETGVFTPMFYFRARKK